MNVLNGLLVAAATLLWMASLGSLENLHGSDAAGNGLRSAFGLFASIALWIVLAILLFVSASQGGWPRWTIWSRKRPPCF
jgi:hypothetical protein